MRICTMAPSFSYREIWITDKYFIATSSRILLNFKDQTNQLKLSKTLNDTFWFRNISWYLDVRASLSRGLQQYKLKNYTVHIISITVLKVALSYKSE